jgi:hypothetical protein
MLGLEANKDLIRRYTHAVFDEGDVDAVDRYLAPDFFNYVNRALARFETSGAIRQDGGYITITHPEKLRVRA